MTEEYTQCLLVRGNCYQMAWIPAEVGFVGETIRTKDGLDWLVAEAYSVKDYAVVNRDSQQYKRQRRASDV